MVQKRWALGGVLICALLASGGLFGEQQPQPSKGRGKLPLYWNRLGLSDEQKKKAVAVQAEYNEKIDALKRDIKKLEDEQSRELRKILTDTQREELRKIAASKTLSDPPSKDEPKPKEQKKPGDK